MRKIACLPDDDRRELFRNTADKMDLNDAIVEKDFWVCFTLDYLFHCCPWKDSITFKGGTSLSKAFNLISRFSEDINLILDWRVLGYGKLEPWEKRSNTKQDAFNKEANKNLLHMHHPPNIKKFYYFCQLPILYVKKIVFPIILTQLLSSHIFSLTFGVPFSQYFLQ